MEALQSYSSCTSFAKDIDALLSRQQKMAKMFLEGAPRHQPDEEGAAAVEKTLDTELNIFESRLLRALDLQTEETLLAVDSFLLRVVRAIAKHAEGALGDKTTQPRYSFAHHL